MSTITISFAVRESKARTSGEAPIQVLLTQNGVRASFSTGKAIHPSEWDRNRQRVRSKEPEAIEINRYLDAIRARLYYLEKVLIDRDIGVSPQLLRDAYLDRLDCLKEWTLMKVVEVHLEDLRAKIGESIATSTVWEYELCGRLIGRYIKQRYSRNDMSIKEVNIDFIGGFHSWLLRERKMKQNTTTKHLKFLQKVMNIAVIYMQRGSLTTR
ncbi:MAG: phage integrase SAM-like domain-containing protein [Alistipes sp.]|nr:phage integrase SAM-like domain-containing protein [Alistipes sp.]